MTWPRGALVCLALLTTASFSMAQMKIFEEPLSPRIVNYRIDVKLDADTKRLKGSEMILWHNKTDSPAEDLRFHLYLNGFRNDQVSFLKESGGRHRGNEIDDDGYGFTEVRSIKVLPHVATETPLDFSDASTHPDSASMPEKVDQMAFLAPDDQNEHDKSYFKIPLDEPLAPGDSVWIHIEWDAQLPQPPFARTGAKEEFFFVAQWFPKIAVYSDGAKWTDHQFHLNTEFFADYGIYDVSMTVPDDHILGATGLEVTVNDNGDGTKTHIYHAEDVHDFAWTSSPDFVVGTGKAQDVDIRVLCQKDHVEQMQRMIDCTVWSVEYFQDWYGDYPFPNLTVVDPRRGAGGAGGMEYPTLITAGTSYGLPDGVRSLEIVTLHEFGHNYWYHLLGSNEWEESWLDEGINSYTESQIMDHKYPTGAVIDWLGFKLSSQQVHRMGYITSHNFDPTVRNGWEYYSNGSYGTNSYSKPAILLTTFHNLVGDVKMSEIMRTYVTKWRFKHPTSQDFIDVVNEVTGEDYTWFFQQALYTRNHVDYAVSSFSSEGESEKKGFDLTLDINEPPNTGDDDEEDTEADSEDEESATYFNEIKIRRLGEFTMPVNIAFTYEDGEVRREKWDGKELWKIYTFPGDKKMVSAAVDPDYIVPMDINWSNNSRTIAESPRMTPVRKTTGNWIVRLQTFMEFLSF